ncbi:CD151 antigen-like [Rhopilema esculentum]|uniref:CD151 antigen-like n=1 Tax=Rhopilema esculentum TaxID=499914 RepID=UPI0031D36EC0
MGYCGRLCARITLVIGNSFFLVLGTAVMALAGWIRYKSGDYDTVLGSNGIQTPSTVILVGGIAIFLVAFLGICGACKENKCCLLLYMAFVGVIMLFEIGCVSVAFAFKGKAEEYVKDAVTKAIQKTYGLKGNGPITEAINNIQKEMKCCGAYSVNDYKNSDWVKNNQSNNQQFPTSCIDGNKKNHTESSNQTMSSETFESGCIAKMKEWGSEHLLILGGLAAAILATEIFQLMAAFTIFKKEEATKPI